jgi:magnesium-transporting ATPase (P-type)
MLGDGMSPPRAHLEVSIVAADSLKRIGSFFVLAVVFALIVFVMIKFFVEDMLSDFFGVAIAASVDVLSLANAWIFILTLLMFLVMFLAVIFSGLDATYASFSLFMAAITAMLATTFISYIGLLYYYPNEFSGVNVLQILGGFNYYNMIFAVYVLHSMDLYFVIVFVVMFSQTFIYLLVTDSFKKKRVKPKNANLVRSKVVF